MHTITRCEFNSYFDDPVLKTFICKRTSMADVHTVVADDFNGNRLEAKQAFEAVYPDAHWPRPAVGTYVKPEVSYTQGGVMIIHFNSDTIWYEVTQKDEINV